MAEPAPGWERLAGGSGGTVAALATVSGAGATRLVFAATPAGVYRSSDGGRTWRVAGAGSTVPFGEALAPSPGFAHNTTTFVGAADGVYRSRDAGATWHKVLTDCRALSLSAAAAADGRELVLVGTETDGILRSEDAGQTWAGANPGLLDLTILCLAMSPCFDQDRLAFAGTPSGLYRTRNGAHAWRAADIGLDADSVQCVAASPDFARDRLVLAGTESSGLLRSDDAGTTWAAVPALGRRGIASVAFSRPGANQPLIAAGTDAGVAISSDGGSAWRMTGADLGPVLSLLFVPLGDGDALLAGLAAKGLAYSTDNGATWTVVSEGLGASLLLGLALSPRFDQDGTVFAAGPQQGVIMSTDRGANWHTRNVGLNAAGVLGVSVSPQYGRDRTLYAATSDGVFRTRDAAATWHRTPGPDGPVQILVGESTSTAAPPLVAALADGRVMASEDDGETWRALREDFDGAQVRSLVSSPTYASDRTLFVGASRALADGGAEHVVWRSTDGGTHWERWMVERAAGVLAIAVPPSYAIDECVFVGLGGRVLKPVRHAREVRGGERRALWRSATLGAGSAAITALAVSPGYAKDRTVFAATNAGVFQSRTGAEHFADWSEGLTPPSVVALAISPGYTTDRLVYALGLGGTIWRRRAE